MTAPADPSSLEPADPAAMDQSLSKDYIPTSSMFDEMEEADGSVRPHWQMFVNLLDDLGPTELERRWETARALIHDNGVTYNVYGDPAGMDRPWNLDAIPFVLGAAEWSFVEAALTQRARLLDHLLADLYGPQRLLHEGLLPPELVFGHRGYLRPLHGVSVPSNRWLHFYAADLGRSSDGQLWVIGDRAQAPSGAGYTLENRLVVSRALPDVFRDCRVQRLASFFRTFRDTLKALAPHNRENPRIVLLTPGPYNETYFEHAYLARYLGFSLVEGGDLTVRDNHVYLKTLGGLQQIDVILRRQDDDFCDPLELRGDSSLGVPGLVQAVHSGNVAVANALGTGMLETPALMMYLPRLCKYILGEELKMPSVGAYWCGDATARSHVLANLHRMVIKQTFNHASGEAVFGETLSRDELDALRRRISACPRDFVGEEQITLSTAPVLVGNRIESRHVVLRAHLVATIDANVGGGRSNTVGGPAGGGGYAVMPGGLTRFSASPDSMIVSMQKGGGSKDTWVLSGGPVDTFSLLSPANQPVDISRAGGDLPSRVADNLYWLGRYMERAECFARLARGITMRLTDQNFESSTELPLLFAALRRAAADDRKNEPLETLAHPEETLARILLDDTFPRGLQATLSSIYSIASLVRDRISADTWRIINRFDRDFPASRSKSVQLNDILPALDRLIITFAAFGGLAMESMTRGYAWRFLDMGRRIERALATVNLIRTTMAPTAGMLPREAPLLESVLEIADSVMTYRRRYMTSLQAAPVLDLLLADETNPRSVAFQLVRLTEHAEALPRPGNLHSSTGKRTAEDRILLRCLTGLRLADMLGEVQPVMPFPTVAPASATKDSHKTPTTPAPEPPAPVPTRARLDLTLSSLTTDLYELSDTLSQTYLSHAIATRQLASGTHSDP